MQLNRDTMLQAYRQMRTIRDFEERLHDEIQTGDIAGFTHLYAGQEAVAAGVCINLTDDDCIISTHRGHGHCIAKGCDVGGMMKEIYGRADGLCHGKGGSMHIADVSKGMLGANGIVGAGAPIAVGAAITAKLRGKGAVSIAFSGDGACNQGTTFEAMNMAVALQVPAIFVFENNHYSEHTGPEYATSTAGDIASRAEAFGMKVWRANGCDFFEVEATFRDLLAYVRETGKPAAIEFDTERFFGHFEGDPQRYRGKGELDRIRAERDCLKIFRESVTGSKVLGGTELDLIDTEVAQLIDQTVVDARAAPVPDAAAVLTNVYVSY
ncbi:thiamine pyrophosphate-dependent dehydrogenase E1 component subunit alpha (plasmid) [Novosphingobium resinovorum]|uniref:thiamine pyrophosphate-dependent dehydrogenase E1 component subunit alpha n=1 Tax=Novosphingobium TaxID=165696 RepID=UPI001B3CA2C9|nr:MULTISPECIES: thiamine pyrophosphate-dependent dehydrogenase E1 component subunit alpha [Novosphingobium]MBF7015260.1 thiamine pyrophosphate-dependent dehydrogenase E1 component subunit alpha [Novosphingobium sp. HR1a]WJM29935.1 thiamine pyrophosphate-dependent dehydrogenase E1 component subunit alpha [Novosphingobium resinovorum]